MNVSLNEEGSDVSVSLRNELDDLESRVLTVHDMFNDYMKNFNDPTVRFVPYDTMFPGKRCVHFDLSEKPEGEDKYEMVREVADIFDTSVDDVDVLERAGEHFPALLTVMF